MNFLKDAAGHKPAAFVVVCAQSMAREPVKARRLSPSPASLSTRPRHGMNIWTGSLCRTHWWISDDLRRRHPGILGKTCRAAWHRRH